MSNVRFAKIFCGNQLHVNRVKHHFALDALLYGLTEILVDARFDAASIFNDYVLDLLLKVSRDCKFIVFINLVVALRLVTFHADFSIVIMYIILGNSI